MSPLREVITNDGSKRIEVTPDTLKRDCARLTQEGEFKNLCNRRLVQEKRSLEQADCRPDSASGHYVCGAYIDERA